MLEEMELPGTFRRKRCLIPLRYNKTMSDFGKRVRARLIVTSKRSRIDTFYSVVNKTGIPHPGNMYQNSDCVSSFFDSEDTMSNSQDQLSSFNTSEGTLNISQSSIGSDTALSLTQLTIEEPEPIRVQPFYNLTPRPMPHSPHYVIEEDFSLNPWAMLVATIFLNKTSGKIARPCLRSFFEEYPSPYHVLSVNPTSMERFFDNLGLRKRSQMIWKLSYQFVSAKWRRASDLCGIGKYGEDAYRMFCLGHTDLEPDDRYLRLYLDWLREHTEYMEDNGVTDSEYVIEDPVLKHYRITLRNRI